MTRAVAVELGVRYALSRRSAISFISFVAVAGLALSVAVLVVVVSVINGMERELKDRVFGMLPQLTLYGHQAFVADPEALERLEQVPGVAGVAPLVQQAGLAAVGNRVTGVVITGIDQRYGAVSDVFKYLEPASAALAGGEFEVLLGAGVARQLEVGVGDQVSLVLPSATVTPAGLFPRQKRFRVTGIVRSRSEIDARAVYIHETDARRLFRLGERVLGYQLRVDDLFLADQVGAEALSALSPGGFFARSWRHTHGNLHHAIGVQKTTMFVLLSFLVAVAAFNLVSTLVMVVDQRRGDVAIMRTLGSDGGTLVAAFLLLGTTLGIVGVLTGLAVGSVAAAALPGLYAWVSTTFSVELMSQYFVSYLPVEIRVLDLTGIALTALVLAMLSTLYPAWRAAHLRPSVVLAHE
ncbi:MAG TPA: ABC transporter permease [Pseudomonadales bacterium]